MNNKGASISGRIVRRAATVAAALALAGGAVMLTAGAAQAAPSGCGAGNFCFWNNANFNDGPGQVAGDNSDYTQFQHASCPFGTWNDCISSVANNGTSGLGVDVFQNVGYDGAVWCVPDGSSDALLPDFYPNSNKVVLNDSISSNRWTTNC